LGYTFGPLDQKDLEIYYIESEKGHDNFVISKKITRTYYILSGNGTFTINGQRYDVNSGMVVEVPPNVEYCYSGKMSLIGLSRPRWFNGNDIYTKWNPDVVGQDFPCAPGDSKSWLARLAGMEVFGKSPLNAYLRIHQRLWRALPSFVISLRAISAYGNFLHRLAKVQRLRAQALSTVFFRNRPELELLRRLVAVKNKGDVLRVAVLGCSTGPEAYSVAWTIRAARPDLRLYMEAVDISRQAVELAERGVYSLATRHLTNTNVAERMTATEIEELFDKDGNVLKVKSWIKEGINWRVADAGDSEIVDILGYQDLVVANNFLCHMDPPEAEKCLRNIARLVRPGGYLCVSGIDLDIRSHVACDLGWKPVEELLEEIHEGDPWLRNDWPFHYAGLEPLNKRRPDWRVRYGTVFQLGSVDNDSLLPQITSMVANEVISEELPCRD
jgi:chemotaxis methyl-accepting protein methylase